MHMLLIDDHALFRAGLCHLLADLDSSVEITEAGSWDTAIAALDGQDYELILTDLVMPGMDPVAAIAALRLHAGMTPIVIVSMLDRGADVRRAITAGASGFIPKTTAPEILLDALRIVRRGGIYLPPSVLNSDEKPAAEANRWTGLTRFSKRQAEVLAELVTGKSNKEIAFALNLSEATIKIHIGAIMRALNVQSRTQAVLTAVRRELIPPHHTLRDYEPPHHCPAG